MSARIAVRDNETAEQVFNYVRNNDIKFTVSVKPWFGQDVVCEFEFEHPYEAEMVKEFFLGGIIEEMSDVVN